MLLTLYQAAEPEALGAGPRPPGGTVIDATAELPSPDPQVCPDCARAAAVLESVAEHAAAGTAQLFFRLPGGLCLPEFLAGLAADCPEVYVHTVLGFDFNALEECLWDTPAESATGCTRTSPGEHRLRNMSCADRLLHTGDRAPAPAARDLLHHLAPGHDTLDRAPRRACEYSGAEPDLSVVHAPLHTSGSHFVTRLYSAHRPLHTATLLAELADLCAGCTFVRGRLWLTDRPATRCALLGIGAAVWLCDGEDWLAEHHSSPAEAVACGADLHDPVTLESLLSWNSLTQDRSTLLAVTAPHDADAQWSAVLPELTEIGLPEFRSAP